MLGALRKIFHREPPTHSPEGFPLAPEWFWYTGCWSSHRYDELQAGRPWRSSHAPWPVEGKIMFNYSWCHGPIDAGQNGRGLVDTLIPAMRLGDLVGLYEVTDHRRMFGSDRAMWDDGIEVQLGFVRTAPVTDVPRLQPLPADAKIDWEHVEIWSYHDPRVRVDGELVEENMYTSHWIDVTVVILGLGREYVNMPWGRAEVPKADEPILRAKGNPSTSGDPMRREGHESDERPLMKVIPEGRDPHEYAEEVGGIVAHGTYIPEGFTRKGHNRNWRSHVQHA